MALKINELLLILRMKAAKYLITALIAGTTCIQAQSNLEIEVDSLRDDIWFNNFMMQGEVDDLRSELENIQNPYEGITFEDIKRQNMQCQDRISRRYARGILRER